MSPHLSECEKLLEPTSTVQFSVALSALGCYCTEESQNVSGVTPPHLMAVRTHVQLRHAHGHTHTWARAHRPGHMLATLAQECVAW